MDRLFLDANVLFSAAYKPDARVRRLWSIKGVSLCTSRYALEEARINLSEEVHRQLLSELVAQFSFFEASTAHFRVVSPCLILTLQFCSPRSMRAPIIC